MKSSLNPTLLAALAMAVTVLSMETTQAQSGTKTMRPRPTPTRNAPTRTTRARKTQSGRPSVEGSTSRSSMPANTQIALSGYCPVCVVEMKKWERGKPAFASTFDSKTYYFPSAEIKTKFDANPQRYVPVLGGDCIVCFAKMKQRVPGSVKHPALHAGRLYLFPSDKEKSAFNANPTAFQDADLAADGECVVCLAKSGKHVKGLPEHTVIYHGLRYQFPSENEANLFRQSPAQYASASFRKNNIGMKSPPPKAVRLVGRSGCAGCEFGVKPMSNPNELGLAIVGNDGRVTIIEDAHKEYPQLYAERFEQKPLVAEGKIVKTDGKFSWLQPTLVMANNEVR